MTHCSGRPAIRRAVMHLSTIRTLIEEYSSNNVKAPQTLVDLVREGYLRQVPVDPSTGSNQTWRIIMEDFMASVNQNGSAPFG